MSRSIQETYMFEESEKPDFANPGGPGCQRGYDMSRNSLEIKINTAAVNISKSGSIICVDS